MLKRMILLLLTVFILLTGNGCKDISAKGEADMESKFLGIQTEYSINWDDKTGDITEQFIVDEQTALEIANIVLKKLKGVEFIDKTDFFVYELADENVIVVNRAPIAKDKLGGGGDISVAINKKDGEVLKIWAGE